MKDIKVSDTTARVLEELMVRVQKQIVSISRKNIAQKLEITPAQLSRCFKELENKGVIVYQNGHMYLDKSLCGMD